MTNDYVKIGRKIVEILASAQFAKPAKKDGKRRNCEYGISCGFTCISAKKVCTSELNPKQIQILNSLRQLAKGGSPIAQSRVDAIRVGQLNKTRLANEKAKLAVMSEVDKIVYESKKQMEETRQAARKLQDEFSRYKDELDKLLGEDIPEPPDGLQNAKDALEKFALERRNQAMDKAKEAIDKALGDHIDDLSKETLSAADEALKKSLIEFLGEKEGQLEWDRMKLDDLVDLSPKNRFDTPPTKPPTNDQELEDLINKSFIDATDALRKSQKAREKLQKDSKDLEKKTDEILDKYKPLGDSEEPPSSPPPKKPRKPKK